MPNINLCIVFFIVMHFSCILKSFELTFCIKIWNSIFSHFSKYPCTWTYVYWEHVSGDTFLYRTWVQYVILFCVIGKENRSVYNPQSCIQDQTHSRNANYLHQLAAFAEGHMMVEFTFDCSAFCQGKRLIAWHSHLLWFVFLEASFWCDADMLGWAHMTTSMKWISIQNIPKDNFQLFQL